MAGLIHRRHDDYNFKRVRTEIVSYYPDDFFFYKIYLWSAQDGLPIPAPATLPSDAIECMDEILRRSIMLSTDHAQKYGHEFWGGQTRLFAAKNSHYERMVQFLRCNFQILVQESHWQQNSISKLMCSDETKIKQAIHNEVTNSDIFQLSSYGERNHISFSQPRDSVISASYNLQPDNRREEKRWQKNL